MTDVEFEEQVDRLKDKLVIVEGKKDKLALEKLGVKEIIMLNKKPLFRVIEDVCDKGKEVAILTDLDKEGKQLYGKLNSGMQRFGIRVDDRFRNFLFKNTKIRQIESLRKF